RDDVGTEARTPGELPHLRRPRIGEHRHRAVTSRAEKLDHAAWIAVDRVEHDVVHGEGPPGEAILHAKPLPSAAADRGAAPQRGPVTLARAPRTDPRATRPRHRLRAESAPHPRRPPGGARPKPS